MQKHITEGHKVEGLPPKDLGKRACRWSIGNVLPVSATADRIHMDAGRFRYCTNPSIPSPDGCSPMGSTFTSL
jgi:hypothetical protein